jgi:HEAT repeat protein
MAVTYRQFRIELYEEHLEEASFLYEQRLGLFHDPEITWLDIGEFEDRLEAHIDALVVGADLALDVCERRSREGDFGELFAAICVFCRQKRKDLVSAVLKNLDVADGDWLRAVTDALKDEMPVEWEDLLFRGVSDRYHDLIPMFAEIVGYRRSPISVNLVPLLKRVSVAALPTLLWALGRQNERAILTWLRPFLVHPERTVRSAAAIALLRLDDERILDRCIDAARSDEAFVLPLALAGGRSAAPLIQAWIEMGKASPDSVIALGVLGELSTLHILYEQLAKEEMAAAAAAALNAITGANLREQVFVPEQFEEDGLFAEELEKFRQGQPPTRPGGEPFGETVNRLSRNPDHWREWLAENRSHFDVRFRYRCGKPFSLRGWLETLSSEYTPYQVRQIAGDEGTIRYGINAPFEASMPVVRQRRVLTNMAEWVRSNDTEYHEGGWYFGGRLLG